MTTGPQLHILDDNHEMFRVTNYLFTGVLWSKYTDQQELKFLFLQYAASLEGMD